MMGVEMLAPQRPGLIASGLRRGGDLLVLSSMMWSHGSGATASVMPCCAPSVGRNTALVIVKLLPCSETMLRMRDRQSIRGSRRKTAPGLGWTSGPGDGRGLPLRSKPPDAAWLDEPLWALARRSRRPSMIT
jgi:hypothetical protein